ncbi:MAG: tetratricopeptide repeat protein [Blastocatellia bacterium]
MAVGKLLRPLIIALALCLSSFGSAQEKSPAPNRAATPRDEEAPLRELIGRYFAAYAQKDLGAMVRMWSEKSPDLPVRFREMQQIFTAEDRAVANLFASKINLRENRAVLQVTADITAVEVETKRTRRERLARSFALIKEAAEWKVWRDAPVSEDLSAFLDRGGEWKASRDPAALDRFAAALTGAGTQEERAGLLADNTGFLTVELRQALVRQAARHRAAANYSALLNAYAAIETVAEKIGDGEGAAIAQAGLGDAMRNLGRNSQALEHFQKALALYEETGNRLQMAAALGEMGLIYLAQNNYSKALECYRKELDFAESFKDKSATANAMEEVASVYYEQGSQTQALEFFGKALKLREAVGSKPELAATLNNIGNAHYEQEDYAAAAGYYQKAIAGFKATGDKQAIAGAMNNLGSAHYLQGDYETAVEFYRESLKIEEGLRDSQGRATSLLGIGLVHYARGDYGPALEYFRKNLALVEAAGDKNRAAGTLHNIGLVYYRRQDYALALENYRKSLTLYEESGDKSEAATMLGLIGGVHFAQGDYALAVESYRRALSHFETTNNTDGMAGMLANLASVNHAQGDFGTALENYRKSLAQYEALEDKERIASTLERMSGVYYSRGDYGQSLDFAERASTLAKQNEYLDTLWRALLAEGVTCRALNQVQKAQQSFEQSIAAIEKMRDGLAGGEQARQRFYKDKRLPYVALMELLLAQGKTGEAFACAERVKINTLSDVVQSGGVRITKAMTSEEQRLEREMENRVISLKAQVNREKQRKQPDQKRLASLPERLQKAQADYRAFEARLYAAHPRLKALRGESRPLKVEDAAALLRGHDDALLEYVAAEGRVYLFVLARASEPAAGSASPRPLRAGERVARSDNRSLANTSLAPTAGPAARPRLSWLTC